MYRAYHAPVRTSDGGLLRNAQGTPTNAVYIFVTMLRKLLNEHKPEYIAASFDLPGRTFRDDLSADYKANRAPMPDELAEQIPMVHAACEALGVPILTSERFEADDVIGTLAEKAAAAGFDVVIVTGDKDFYQLVRDGIRVFNPRDEGTWYDAAAVKHKRYREGLLANVESARQSKELARIRTDVPVDFDPEAVRFRGGSRER